MRRENDKKESTRPRRRYQAPMISREEQFERLAFLCNLATIKDGCTDTSGSPS